MKRGRFIIYVKRLFGSRSRGAPIILFSFFAALIIIFFSALIQKRASPYAAPLSENKARAIISSAICEELEALCSGEQYKGLIRTSYTADGRISHVSLDPELSSSLVSALCERLNKRLSYVSVRVRLPIGTLLFGKAFSGKGLPIGIKSTLSAFSLARISTSLVSAGVNQTLHTVTLELSVEARLICLGKTHTVSLEKSTVIAETLVVGSTPDGFFGQGT